MKILHCENISSTRNASQELRAQEMMSVVQGLVQIWIKYESALHKEIATQQRPGLDASVSKSMNSYVDYGIFYRVSSSIYRKKELTMGELSSSLAIPFSTATRFVDMMVAYGYVIRMRDPDDRRVVRVGLTHEGVELHRTIESFTGEHVRSIMASLDAEEQQLLVKLTRKVITALEKAT
jgi:DNA-binding MarR family transcriptional regulator